MNAAMKANLSVCFVPSEVSRGSSGAHRSRRCRVLALDTPNDPFTYADCNDRHPYLCQRGKLHARDTVAPLPHP